MTLNSKNMKKTLPLILAGAVFLIVMVLVLMRTLLAEENKNTERVASPVPAAEAIPMPKVLDAPLATTSLPDKNGSRIIIMQNFAFNPSSVMIPIGTKITWKNLDTAPHDVKSSSFGSPLLRKGEEFSFVFSEKGTYDYICSIHPSMKAQIIVQ